MEKSAQKITTVSKIPKKLGNLGFTIAQPFETSKYVSQPLISPGSPIVLSSSKRKKTDKFTTALKNFEDSINPTLKNLIKNQRLEFRLGSDKQNHFRLGRIGTSHDGSAILGIKYTRKL